jgi:hypothetical protein
MPEIELSENLKKELKEKLQKKQEQRKEDVARIRKALQPYFPDVSVFMNGVGRIVIKIVDTTIWDTDFKIVYDILHDIGYSNIEFQVYVDHKDYVGVSFTV